jgi:hypothetical protein
MPTLGEFSSLLQLGVGFGVGLSFFRAPITLILGRLQSDLTNEMNVLQDNRSPGAGRSRAALSDIKVDTAEATKTLDKFSLPFLIASLIGAGVNWSALIWASFCAERPLNSTEEWILTFVAVGWFLLIGIIISTASAIYLLPLVRRLAAVRVRV